MAFTERRKRNNKPIKSIKLVNRQSFRHSFKLASTAEVLTRFIHNEILFKTTKNVLVVYIHDVN